MTKKKYHAHSGPTPERYALSGSEDAHQISLFMWAASPEIQAAYPELKYMHAIPNGGFRKGMEAARLKAMGVKRGVSDIFLPVKRGEFSGLYIELKRPPSAGKREGKATNEQTDFMAFVKSQGFGAIKCIGWESARDTIIAYMNWGK